MRPLALILFVLSSAASAAEPNVATVDYRDGDLALKGFIAKPATLPVGGAPGVLIVHDWYGNGPMSQRRALELAKHGYVAFALDMYGGGQVVGDNGAAGKLAGPFYKTPDLFVSRARAGLAQLKAQAGVDGKHLAAIGFCFGGSTVLQLARAGEPLQAVVSFHGGLKTAAPATKPGQILAPLLIQHGGADTYVPPTELAAFLDEVNTAKASYRIDVYGGAVHAFTRVEAGNDPSQGAAYDADADARSFAAMYAFFDEKLK